MENLQKYINKNIIDLEIIKQELEDNTIKKGIKKVNGKVGV